MTIRFMEKEEVIAEQERQLAYYGGGAPGILDAGKLDGAVNLPRMTFGEDYLLPDLHSMGAAYLTYLVKDHAFEQGNKRIGLAAALIFLRLNGIEVTADNDALIDLTLKVAAEGLSREEAAEFFQANHRQVEVRAGDNEALESATEWMHAAFAPAFRKLAE